MYCQEPAESQLQLQPLAARLVSISDAIGADSGSVPSVERLEEPAESAQKEATQLKAEAGGQLTASEEKEAKKKKRRKKKKRPPHKSKMITGYIIYASEIRKDVIKLHPNRVFGDISKLVGIEWKNLPQETKVAYEKRAQEQNAKSRVIAAEALELKRSTEALEMQQQQLQEQHQQQQQLSISNGNSSQMPQEADEQSRPGEDEFGGDGQDFIMTSTTNGNQATSAEQVQQQAAQNGHTIRPISKEPLRFSQKFINHLNNLVAFGI